MFISEVQAKQSEVLINTQVMISCVVSGLTKQLEKVTWEKPKIDVPITDGEDGYKIDEGTYQGDSNSQTTVLTISADKNTADTVYTCVIQSDEHGKTSKSQERTDVTSDVFSEYTFNYKMHLREGRLIMNEVSMIIGRYATESLRIIDIH